MGMTIFHQQKTMNTSDKRRVKVSTAHNVTLELKWHATERHSLQKSQTIIFWLSSRNGKVEHQSEHAKYAADTLIVKTAIDMALNQTSPVVVVAQDTDVLLLLCYHRAPTATNLYLLAGYEGPYDIRFITIDVKDEFLFKYGWSGCDTESYIHIQTKCFVFKINFNGAVMKQMRLLKASNNLVLRPWRSHMEPANRGKMDPERLPSTDDASTQHALSVQHQLITGKHTDTEMWSNAGRGWEININDKFNPRWWVE